MELVLFEKKYKIRGKNITGVLVDCHFNEKLKENVYILESDEKDENGEFPLYTVRAEEIEE